jgi:hypothetical protein
LIAALEDHVGGGHDIATGLVAVDLGVGVGGDDRFVVVLVIDEIGLVVAETGAEILLVVVASWADLHECFAEEWKIVGEVLGNFAGSGVDGSAIGWRESGEKFFDGGGEGELIFGSHAEIVEDESYVALADRVCGWCGCRDGWRDGVGRLVGAGCVCGFDGGGCGGFDLSFWSFDAEGGDGLRFDVVEELEVIFFEAGDDVALGVASYHADEDEVYLDADVRFGVAGGDFGFWSFDCRGRCWRLLRSGRRWGSLLGPARCFIGEQEYTHDRE